MYKIRLILADPDSKYVDKVAEYINSSFSARIQVSSFTKVDLLEDCLRSSPDKIDVLLAHPEFLRQAPDFYQNIVLVVLLADGAIDQRHEEFKSVDKFQPGDKLVYQLLNLYSEQNTRVARLVTGSKQTKLAAVYSPAGGVGKTSIVLGLAARLSEQGNSVFGLSLETSGSIFAVLSCTGNDALTHILLSLSENVETLPVKAEAYKTRDYLYNLDFFEPPDCFLELSELAAGDLRSLLIGLKHMGKYDVVLIDLDSTADEKLLTVFNCCDEVILVQAPDSLCRFKTEVFLGQVRRIGLMEPPGLWPKLILVINKDNGTPAASLEQNGFKANYRIPFCQNLWSYENGRCIFDPDRVFSNSLTGLAGAICPDQVSG